MTKFILVTLTILILISCDKKQLELPEYYKILLVKTSECHSRPVIEGYTLIKVEPCFDGAGKRLVFIFERNNNLIEKNK